jgi:hypothetical protein
MAKRSVAYKSDRGQIPNTANYKTDLPASVSKMLAGPSVTRNLKGNFFGGFGDERTGITTVSERMSPVKAAAPTRMAVNRVTGDTTGFTSGKTTGSTVTKAGVATKTGGTAFQQMQRNAMAKRGEAGPRKDSSGRNVSSMTGNRTATSSASRSTGGASRSSRGGMEKFGPGTGSKR